MIQERKMRRRDREITEREDFLHILDTCEVIHIAMHDEEDGIYIIPMNYGYIYEGDELTFYIHSGMDGRKLELLEKNPKVGFELDCDHEMIEGKMACQYGYRYASIIGTGTAEFIEEPEGKMEALTILMRSLTGKEFEFNERLVSIVNVIKIHVKEFRGKKRE